MLPYRSFCHSYCPHGASLSAVPAGVVSYYRPTHSGVVSHYQPWCFIIGHFATHTARMVPHYQLCLLVHCHCNRYFISRVQVEEGWLQFCYSYRGAISPDMAADPVSLADMPACTVISIRHACWVHLFRYMCL